MLKVGSAVHTAHGPGTVIDTDTVRGRTQFKVAGQGFSAWLDETKIAASGEDSGIYDHIEEAHRPTKGRYDPEEAHRQDVKAAESNPNHYMNRESALGDVDESNSTTLPYDYEPQHPVEMYNQEQSMSPDHYVDADDLLSPTNSVTGESEGEPHEYPGPASHLFATSSYHYADADASVGDGGAGILDMGPTEQSYGLVAPAGAGIQGILHQTGQSVGDMIDNRDFTPDFSMTGQEPPAPFNPGPKVGSVRTAAPGSMRHYMQWAQQAGMQPNQAEAASLYGSTHGLDEGGVSKLLDHFDNQGQRTSAADGCEYCGKPGHDWDAHPEAVRDVMESQRELQREEFPFGDYQPGEVVPEDFDGYEHFASRTASKAEEAAMWDSFNYELCPECGQDADRHAMGRDLIGLPHLYCLGDDEEQHTPFDTYMEGISQDPGFEDWAMGKNARTAAGAWGDVDVESGKGGGSGSRPGSFDHYIQYAHQNGMHPKDGLTAERYSREHGVPNQTSSGYAMQVGNGRQKGDGLRPGPTSQQMRGGSYRPAGLSDKYIDIQAAVDPTDPITQFRNDPVTYIERTAYLVESSTGLDLRVGQYMDLVEADPMIRQAAWSDVQQKAMRLKREGAVKVEDMAPNFIMATVNGDNGTYSVVIRKGASYGGFDGGQDISQWHCGCEWGKWAFKRKLTFVGRLCSHAYASYLTMQSAHQTGGPRMTKQPKRKAPSRSLPTPFVTRGPGGYAKSSSALSEFKTWAEEENGGTVDVPSADAYISELEEPLTPSEAQEIHNYAYDNMTERPEREYDVDGYTFDPDEVYKGGNGEDSSALRSQNRPNRLSPDLYAVPQGEGQTWTNLDDDRKTTGPDQITAKVEKNWAKKQNNLDDEASPIVRFSARKEALTYTADENLLEKLRDLSAESPSENFGNMAERNKEVAEVIGELRDRGYDASLFVAMRREAIGPGINSTQKDDDETGGLSDLFSSAEESPNRNPFGDLGSSSETVGGGLPESNGQQRSPEQLAIDRTDGTPDPGNPGGGGNQVQQVNNTTPNPGSGGAGGGSSWSENNNTDPIGPGEYTIQSGDTYSNLAERAGWGENYEGFADATGYQSDSPDDIFAGDKMNVVAPPGVDPADPMAPAAPEPGAAAPMSGAPGAPPAPGPAPADANAAPDPGVGGGLGLLAPPAANPAAPAPLVGDALTDPGLTSIASRFFFADEDDDDSLLGGSGGADKGVGGGPAAAAAEDAPAPTPAPAAAAPAATPASQSVSDPAPPASPAAPKEPVQEPSDGSKSVLEDEQPQNATSTSNPMGDFNNIMPILEGVGSAVLPLVTNTLGPVASGIGNAIGSGLSGLFTAGVVTDGDDTALGDDDAGEYDNASTVDPAFAGSGPSRKDWYGTSEDWISDHEYLDLNDEPEGDLISYRKQPKQAGYDDGSDIVRQFQANIGNTALGSNAGGGGSYSDDAIAQAAQGFLRTAGRVYSLAEQQELMDEEHPKGARNLPGLDLRGTHYLEG